MKPKEILSDGELVFKNWDYGDLDDFAEDCLVYVEKSHADKLEKLLSEAVEALQKITKSVPVAFKDPDYLIEAKKELERIKKELGNEEK